MSENEIQRQNERRKILLNRIKQEFPGAEIIEILGEYQSKPWCIRIEIISPFNAALVLEPDRPLMTDLNNGFERFFEEGIFLAKEIFKNPRSVEIYQGKVILSSIRGVSFQSF